MTLTHDVMTAKQMMKKKTSTPITQVLPEDVCYVNIQYFGTYQHDNGLDESDGVERANGEILRHLRALVNDERIKKKWSKPYALPLIEFALNDRKHMESPHLAFELKFESKDARYFKLPETLEPAMASNAWLRELNESLRVVRE